MLVGHLPIVVATVLVAAEPARPRTGEIVIVISPEAAELRHDKTADDVKSGGDVIPFGSHVRVDGVDGERLRISWRGKRGTAAASQVIPVREGESYFTEAIRDDPSAKHYLARGYARLQSRNYRDALADIVEATRLAPSDPDVYFHRGLYCTYTGDRRRACEEYSLAIRLDPTYVWAYGNRASMRPDDDLDGKLSDCDAAVRLDPNNALHYGKRAGVLERKGDFDRALDDYAEAVRLDPDDWTTFAMRGLTYGKLGRWDEAIADQTEAIRLLPEFAGGYGYRGDAWLAKGDPEHAVADFEEAIRLSKKPGAALFEGLARAYAGLGEFEKAEEQVETAIGLDPEDDDTVRTEMLKAFQANRPWRPAETGNATGQGGRDGAK